MLRRFAGRLWTDALFDDLSATARRCGGSQGAFGQRHGLMTFLQRRVRTLLYACCLAAAAARRAPLENGIF